MNIQSRLISTVPGFILLGSLLLFTGTAQAFVGALVVAMGRAADADPIKVEFSADAQVETEDNKLQTRVFFKPGKLRDEMQMDGQKIVTIQRFDLNKSWMLMGQGMYMENEIGKSDQAPEYKLIEKTIVGKEVVNGMPTTKYKTIYQGPKGKLGGFTWLNADNIAVKGFMVSTENGEKQRIMFELHNIKIGDQDEALFELPSGARKFDMGGFGNMANGMPQSAPQQEATHQGEPASDDKNSSDEDHLAGDVAEAAKESAKETTVEETKHTVKEGIRSGFRSLFGKP